MFICGKWHVGQYRTRAMSGDENEGAGRAILVLTCQLSDYKSAASALRTPELALARAGRPHWEALGCNWGAVEKLDCLCAYPGP